MRWSYKTVHYELKKEGLLGSSFLDESEVEQSLNEYGKAGWELVSILETQEGLIAVFKQPLSVGKQTSSFSEEDVAESQYVPLRPKKDEFRLEPAPNTGGKRVGNSESLVVPIDEYEIVVDEQEEKEKKSPPVKDDIGSIAIE
jgi:Domain of unknown function (DUF4177)